MAGDGPLLQLAQASGIESKNDSPQWNWIGQAQAPPVVLGVMIYSGLKLPKTQ
jgi:hypothetical protein